MKLNNRVLSAITSAVCTLTVCASALTISASAAGSGTADNLTYYAYEDHVVITGCDPTSTSAIIPAEILNLPVTEIAEEAFENCISLTRVDIPDSVKSIGASAFNGCTVLQSVSIPESVVTVGSAAFWNTYIVNQQEGPVFYVSNWAVDSDPFATAVEIKNTTTGIADGAFSGGSLETVTIPATVDTIGAGAFSNNSNIRTVVLPNGVETLGNYAFYGCSSLLKVTMPTTLTAIGEGAYANCTSLKDIKIPTSVTEIGADAFEYTAEYSAQEGPVIYIDSWAVNCLDSTEQLSIVLSNGTKGVADGTFEGKTFVKSATIPAGVKTVGDYAFDGCTSLSQLSLPESLTTIGSYAFCETSIPSIEVPASVTTIGDSAFRNCKNLSDITINNAACNIYQSEYTISDTAKMHVAENSTAYDYAIKFDRNFDYDINSSAVIPGDVNGSGAIDLQDIIIICKSMLGTVTLTNEQIKIADLNNSGTADLQDAIAVAKLLVNAK